MLRLLLLSSSARLWYLEVQGLWDHLDFVTQEGVSDA